jgi:RimJ/RimL family protein N-acetyltransferase
MYASLSEQTRLLFSPPLLGGNLFVRLIEKFKFIMSCFLTLRKVLLKIFPRAVVIPIVAVNKNGQIIGLSYIKILNWCPRSTYIGVSSSVVTDKYQNKGLGYQMIMLQNNAARFYNISKIYGHILATNKCSLHVMLKLGYTVVCRYRVLSKHIHKGKMVDEYMLVYNVRNN